ncbi:MAG: TolC family protein [Nitrosomonas sp.]|uniref:TolC family protein n=1 Tax=Nitrosomonas sp. TaxID=42353 RepID=UPI002733946A|nr:TolC family protein [Nitrosomonas sp.]MDP3280479.1 TolC family protein [Nitrosomonas sp.]
MQVVNIASLVVLSIALVGCITAPQRQVKEVGAVLPDQWGDSETFSQPIPTQWVETFGDAQLNALVDTALASNYELKAAAARVGAAVAQARIDGSSRWPQFFFTADHQQVQIREAGFGASRFGVFEALFGLSWEVDVWGRIRVFQQASVFEADAMNTDYYGARLSLAARVAQSYF